MFLANHDNFVQVGLFTTRYLGRQIVWEAVSKLLAKYGGIYVPERWGTEERTKYRFEPEQFEAIKSEWISPDKIKSLYFTRRKPVEILISFAVERFSRAKFNECTIYIRDKSFESKDKSHEFFNFVIDLSLIIQADYGFISHTLQERRQSPILTPAERLPGVYWANFFGRPYIEFFGREKLLAAPCYEVREINKELILLLTAETLKDPELIENDAIVNQVRAYLNQNAFAGPNFPDEKCSVPAFDFTDVRWSGDSESQESRAEKLRDLQRDLETKGYELIDHKNGRLVFRGVDDSLVLIDKDSAEMSINISGETLPEKDSESPLT